MAVREGVGERGVQGLGPGLLHRALQLGPPAQRVRGLPPMSCIVGVNNVMVHGNMSMTRGSFTV